MSEQIVQDLQKALDLIKAGKASQARPILVNLLRENDQLEQAWFLLSYTLPEQDKQEEALVKALQINPAFDKASERLAKLRGTPIPEEEEVESGPEPQEAYETAFATDDEDDKYDGDEDSGPQESNPYYGESEFIDDGEEEEPPRRFPVRKILIAVVVLVLLITIVIFGAQIFSSLLTGGGLPVLFTETPTPGMRQLPPTWTPTPQEGALSTPHPEAFLLP